MREYWLTKELLQAASIAFVLMTLGLIFLALWLPKRRWGKFCALVAVAIVFSIPFRHAYQEMHQQQMVIKQYQSQLLQARSVFDERCKKAGEKIFRIVEDVEGILLENVRERGISSSVLKDPNWPDAALPNEPGQEGYIMSFLLWEHFQDKRNDRGYLNNVPSDLPGFQFVDVRDPNGVVNRFRLILPEAREMSKESLRGRPTRYAVSFQNMTDLGDRALWVAGTTVKVTDSVTGELIAEKTWYAMDPGQGNTAGERSPWAYAHQCPRHRGWSGALTRYFVDKALKPIKGR